MNFTFQVWQLALLLIATITITVKATKFYLSAGMFFSAQRGELFIKSKDGKWFPYDPTIVKKEEYE